MRKVMIVEDEMLVRVGIKSIINWESHGLTIVGEASDGEEALEKIQKLQPDLIFTDLMMHPMDGFDLIRICSQKYPSIRFIVLSNYNDFENVKRAMKLGAVDYIFKLMAKPDDILKTIQEIKWPAESSTASDTLLLKNITELKASLIRKGVEQSYYSEAEYQAEIKDLGLHIDFTKPYVVMTISINNFSVKQTNELLSQPGIAKYSIENITAEILSSHFAVDVCSYQDGDLLVFTNLTAKRDYHSICHVLQRQFPILFKNISRYLSLSITGVLSDAHVGVQEISEAVKRNRLALSYRFHLKPGQLNLYNAIALGSQTTLPSACRPEKLEQAFSRQNLTNIYAFMDSIFSFFYQNSNLDIQQIRSCLLEVYYIIKKYLNQHGIEAEKCLDKNGLNGYQAIKQYDFLTDIQSACMQLIDLYSSAVNKKMCREEVVVIKEHVLSDLSGEYSVAWAANKVNMSESYFSHIFKKETGSSFMNWVNQMRVKKACRLLLTTDRTVGEIAAQVGVENPNYFSVLFKKLTGKSPMELRSSNQSI